jgi:sugar/nucleoside kinase (ribokinase family)
MVSKIGSDGFGEEILENFRTQGVDTQHVTKTNEATTAIANILVNGKG